MSAPEHVQETDAIGSRVKLARNAKLEATWEISIREGTQADEVDRLRKLAIEQYRELEREFA